MSTETSPGKPFLEILLRHSPSPVSTSCPKAHLPLTPGRRATSSILPGMNLHSLTRTNPPPFPGNLWASPVPSNIFSNQGLFIKKCALTNPVWALAFQIQFPIAISPPHDLKVLRPRFFLYSSRMLQLTLDKTRLHNADICIPRTKIIPWSSAVQSYMKKVKKKISNKQKVCQAFPCPQQKEYFMLLCIVILVSISSTPSSWRLLGARLGLGIATHQRAFPNNRIPSLWVRP